jgi:hypothetical protein
MSTLTSLEDRFSVPRETVSIGDHSARGLFKVSVMLRAAMYSIRWLLITNTPKIVGDRTPSFKVSLEERSRNLPKTISVPHDQSILLLALLYYSQLYFKSETGR